MATRAGIPKPHGAAGRIAAIAERVPPIRAIRRRFRKPLESPACFLAGAGGVGRRVRPAPIALRGMPKCAVRRGPVMDVIRAVLQPVRGRIPGP